MSLRALRKGSKVEILEEETWLRVKAKDGKIGYVLADHIEMEESALVNHSNLVFSADNIDISSDQTLRWGGDFSKEDPVHIDDNLNHRNPARWDAKLASR